MACAAQRLACYEDWHVWPWHIGENEGVLAEEVSGDPLVESFREDIAKLVRLP